ncbi:hypothetical protein RHGRI_035063 [Rhododendron griersonianum]|uniref:Uncharacterized protein n=1 Tax=Rhododendron griersonianum TaxID=479676 RepID=A0AAV6I6D1_9ERIC|nr:hypothetical protein RHGRI_035063 [Rhododendron griersonianum]
MALRLLGRKLMIVKPQKLGFYFRNSSHTAVVHDNPPSDSHARIRPSVNLVMEYSVRPDQYEDDVLEENRRLKEGNCQLIENCRLKAENHQLIENRRLKEENRRLIERRVEFIAFDTSSFFSILTLGLFSYRLKTVEEEIIGVLQHDTNKDDASTTINELFEKVTRLEEKILGDLHRYIQNERDGWKSLETKEENRRLKEENRQLVENRRLKEENRQLIENHRLKEENRQLIERLKPVEEETIGDLQCDTHKDDASTTINELSENVTRLEQKILGDLHHDIQNERDRCKSLETKQEHDWLKKEEVPRLKKENCQLTEREPPIERKLEEASRKIEEMNKVGENLRDILSEERKRQDIKKENLRTKLKDDASNTINGLFGKVTRLEQTVFGDLHNEKDRCNSLETKLDKALRENEQMEEELDRLRRYD